MAKARGAFSYEPPMTEDSDGLPAASFRLILDAFSDAVLVADADNRIVYANQAVTPLLGWASPDLLGMEVAELVPERLRQRHLAGFRRFIATGDTRIMGRSVRLPALRKDGTEVPIDLTLSAFTIGGRDLVVGTMRDVTPGLELERETEVTRDLLHVVAQATNLDDASTRILETICQSLGWDAGALWVLDEDSEVLRCLEFWFDPQLELEEFASLSRRRAFRKGIGLPGRVWASEDGAWITDIQEDDNFPRALAATKEGLHAGFGFPIRARDRFIGVIEFFATEIREQDPGLLQTMTAIGGELGHFIRRKRLDEDLEESNQRLAFIAGASRILAASLDYRATLEQITRLAVPSMADWCAIDVVEEGTIQLLALAHVDPSKTELAQDLRRRYPPDPDADSGVPNVVRTGVSELYSDIDDTMIASMAADDDHLAILRGLRLSSAMIVPLAAKGQVTGTLTLISDESGRRYGPDDIAFAEEVARRAGLAIENARLYEQQRHIARTLQRSLLPTSLPEIPQLDVATSYRPAAQGTEVGGDFYDLFQSPDGWCLMIGDVSGKGVEAAAVTALTRYTVRTAALNSPRPKDVLEVLNQAMLEQLPEDRYCTIAYGTMQLNGREATLQIACAGHPPPLILRVDGTINDACGPGGLLGLFPDPEIVDSLGHLGPGDLLLLYTDGVIESWEEKGDEALKTTLSRARGLSAAETIAHIEDDALAASDGGHRDDFALMAIKLET
jgi:PAS domain S-box-containing protein